MLARCASTGRPPGSSAPDGPRTSALSGPPDGWRHCRRDERRTSGSYRSRARRDSFVLCAGPWHVESRDEVLGAISRREGVAVPSHDRHIRQDPWHSVALGGHGLLRLKRSHGRRARAGARWQSRYPPPRRRHGHRGVRELLNEVEDGRWVRGPTRRVLRTAGSKDWAHELGSCPQPSHRPVSDVSWLSVTEGMYQPARTSAPCPNSTTCRPSVAGACGLASTCRTGSRPTKPLQPWRGYRCSGFS